jgi:hypothetical protein
MKTMFALALISFSLTAQARAPQYLTIDMTGRHFTDDGYNIMGDETPTPPKGDSWDGLQLKLDGVYGKDFTVEAKATNPADACKILDVAKGRGVSFVRIDADPETDSGDTCDITIRYKDGRHAMLSIVSEGT